MLPLFLPRVQIKQLDPKVSLPNLLFVKFKLFDRPHSLYSKTEIENTVKPGLSYLICCSVYGCMYKLHIDFICSNLKQNGEGLRSKNLKHPSFFS